jgi:uridine phosphorylase
MPQKKSVPILENKYFTEPSVFQPQNLLREARRQKQIPNCNIPAICVLDPDGDLVDYLLEKGKAKKSECWACYHSHLYTFRIENTDLGIIPCIVGSSYAVLVSEQLFASGCKFLISITSSGIISKPENNQRFALITESVRDEGTSYHYLPKEIPAKISDTLYELLNKVEKKLWFNVKSWTTDAPYRETETAILAMQEENVTCVEMEASALYAFAQAKQKHIVCFAHLTNTMAQKEGDFEKGQYFGSLETLELIEQVIENYAVVNHSEG